MQQQLGSHGGSDAVGEITEFKSKEAVEISTPATPKTESLKNRETPSQADNPGDPNRTQVIQHTKPMLKSSGTEIK